MIHGKHNSIARRAMRRVSGFTMLELMIVMSVMLILMAVAIPLYQHHVVQAREAVLKENLRTLNQLIEAYREDQSASPQSLDDLKAKGYLHEIPLDPMTGKADWTTEPEDYEHAVDPQQPGIDRVHSASTGTSLEGTAYSTW